MAKGLNLKAIFSADTSNLKQGSKEATNAIKSFEKESSGALGSLAGAMGINIDQIKRFSEVGKGAGIAIANSFKNVNNEAKLILGSIAGIAVGVGALAVGAAVASWKELNKQADYFYQNSVEGAIKLAGLNAYTDTLKNAIRELNDPKAAAELTGELEKRSARIGATLSSWWQKFSNVFHGIKEIDWMNPAAFSNAVLGETSEQMPDVIEKAKAAEATASKLKEAQIELSRIRAEEVSKLKEQYEIERVLAKDSELSAQERLQHQNKAKSILEEMQRKEIDALEKVVDLQKELNSYTMTAYNAQISAYELEQRKNLLSASYKSQQRELKEGEKTITNEINKQVEAKQKLLATTVALSMSESLDAMTQDDFMNIPFAELQSEADAFFNTLSDGMSQTAGSFNLDLLDVEAAKALDAAKAVAQQINNSFSGIIQGSISGFSDLIGQSIAGTADFADGLWAMFGDILKRLGEIAIAAGVGMLGIKEAFKTLNPWVAITAGAALVALGAAISNSVSSLSNDIGYAGGGYVTSGSAAGYANNLNRAPSSEGVEVTGKFELKGDDLVALIVRKTKRKLYVG